MGKAKKKYGSKLDECYPKMIRVNFFQALSEKKKNLKEIHFTLIYLNYRQSEQSELL